MKKGDPNPIAIPENQLFLISQVLVTANEWKWIKVALKRLRKTY